ncbi:MAG: glycine cleavage system protein GcvH [Simkaniaceae bacterium]|nr:glycine cleavage system protein GcvH [Simkaniaceae bacterium]
MKQYTETHEWILVDEGVATIGISHQAQEELGEIVYLELPEIHQELKKDDSAVILESTKAATDIASPLSGTVTEVNEKLLIDLSLINQDPEGEGWLYRLKMD